MDEVMRRWLIRWMVLFLLVGLSLWPVGSGGLSEPQPPLSVCPKRDPGPNSGWVRIPQEASDLFEAVGKAIDQGLYRVWIGPGLHDVYFSVSDVSIPFVIYLDHSFIICGMGPDFSILKAEEVADGFLRITGDGEFILEGFSLTGGRNAVLVIGGMKQRVTFNDFRVLSTRGTGIEVYSPYSGHPEVLLYNAEVLGIGTGLDLIEGRITIWRSLIAGNGEGIRITWKAQLTIRESRISGNRFGGIATDGDVQVTIIESEIYYNGSNGIVLGGRVRLEAIDNRIFANEGYGIKLIRKACGNQIDGSEGVEIRGRGNEIRDNQKGDLCPPDFPWPPGFVKP